MRHEILLNVTPLETRAAVIEQGMVQEIVIERASHRGLVGNVYLGRVIRVLPGMQACFVEVGLERSAFLHAKDVVVDDALRDEPIAKLVHEGQNILVQVIKDPVGTKGARLTAEISLPARHVVLMPLVEHIGISQRIEDETTREQLKALAVEARQRLGVSYGLIVRTAGDGHTLADFESDLQYLHRVWTEIIEKQKSATAPCLLFADLQLSRRVLRDVIRPETERLWVDSQETYQQLIEFAERYMPDLR